MNYEELLAAKNNGKLNITRLPIGEYYRTKVDGKYRGVVDIRPELNQSVVFSEALKTECARNIKLVNNHQLHFSAIETEGDVTRLEVEQGVFFSIEDLLSETPAVIAQKDFIDNVLTDLVNVTTYLHQQGIKHVCYSPKTVFVRKGDHSVMLLSHGSFYLGMNNLEELYGDDIRYVAPEVLQHGTVDERCDVYSIGLFMQELLTHADTPLEYRQAIKKAVSEKPEDRFATPADMLKAIKQRRSTFKTLISLIAAFVIAFICVALYFDMMPGGSDPVEFVKPAPRQAIDDIYDDGFDPSEMGITNADTLSDEEQRSMREYQAKAEAIFRKNYEKEANRILDKIYNKENMSNSEKTFLSKSQSVIEELVQRQEELSADAGISPQRADQIAGEINDRLSNQKKKALGSTNSRGIQK